MQRQSLNPVLRKVFGKCKRKAPSKNKLQNHHNFILKQPHPMSLKISHRFLKEIAYAAEKLSEKNPVIRLEGIYSMFYVSLQMPDLESTAYTFLEIGIDRPGKFYLYSTGVL